MKGKMEDLQEIRGEVEKLRPADDNFTPELTRLINRTTSHLGEIDDEQEISWCAKSFEITEQIRKGEIEEENELQEKDLALTYLKEALDTVIIRERRYLE